MAFRTEFPFRLPKGFVNPDTGELERDGIMRLATARDEIEPLQDYRVQSNRAYLVILLLSRVVSKLGSVQRITPTTIENLFSTDLAYLQEFYRKINEEGQPLHHVACPSCQAEFDVDMVTGQVFVEGESAGKAGAG
jgi:hypothetical protein